MTAPTDGLVQATHAQIARNLRRIATLFVPEMRLTLVARHLDYPDGSRDMVVTDDTLSAVITALTIRESKP